MKGPRINRTRQRVADHIDIMGRLGRSRQMDCGRREEFPRLARGLVPAEPAPSTRLKLGMPTRQSPPYHRRRPLLSFAHKTKRNIGLLPVLRV